MSKKQRSKKQAPCSESKKAKQYKVECAPLPDGRYSLIMERQQMLSVLGQLRDDSDMQLYGAQSFPKSKKARKKARWFRGQTAAWQYAMGQISNGVLHTFVIDLTDWPRIVKVADALNIDLEMAMVFAHFPMPLLEFRKLDRSLRERMSEARLIEIHADTVEKPEALKKL